MWKAWPRHKPKQEPPLLPAREGLLLYLPWLLRAFADNAHHHPPAGFFAVDINIEPGRVNDDVRQSSQNIQQATFLCPETTSKSTGLDRSLGPCCECYDWLSAQRVTTSSPSRYLAAWISLHVCRDKESATSIPAEP